MVQVGLDGTFYQKATRCRRIRALDSIEVPPVALENGPELLCGESQLVAVLLQAAKAGKT